MANNPQIRTRITVPRTRQRQTLSKNAQMSITLQKQGNEHFKGTRNNEKKILSSETKTSQKFGRKQRQTILRRKQKQMQDLLGRERGKFNT